MALAFLGPAPAVDGSVVQIWVYGGHVSPVVAVGAILGARFPDRRKFRLTRGWDGETLFAVFWERGDAVALHGNIFFVGNARVVCAKVDPAQVHDQTMPEVLTVLQVV